MWWFSFGTNECFTGLVLDCFHSRAVCKQKKITIIMDECEGERKWVRERRREEMTEGGRRIRGERKGSEKWRGWQEYGEQGGQEGNAEGGRNKLRRWEREGGSNRERKGEKQGGAKRRVMGRRETRFVYCLTAWDQVQYLIPCKTLSIVLGCEIGSFLLATATCNKFRQLMRY